MESGSLLFYVFTGAIMFVLGAGTLILLLQRSEIHNDLAIEAIESKVSIINNGDYLELSEREYSASEVVSEILSNNGEIKVYVNGTYVNTKYLRNNNPSLVFSYVDYAYKYQREIVLTTKGETDSVRYTAIQ